VAPGNTSAPSIRARHEISEPEQCPANQELLSLQSASMEGVISHPSLDSGRFVMEEDTNFEETFFDSEVNMFGLENGLRADIWEDLSVGANFGSHQLDNLVDSTAPTLGRDSHSSSADSQFQRSRSAPPTPPATIYNNFPFLASTLQAKVDG
jgi:hypothetical protein